METLHPKAVWLFFFRYLIVTVVIFAYLIIFISSAAIAPSVGGSLIITVVGFMILLAYFLFLYVAARLSLRYWRYELTADALKIERGVIMKKYISIPYERIQNIDIYRGLVARIIGLSDLQIQTAGYSSYSGRGGQFNTEGRLPGLDPKIAESLREILVQKSKGARQGL